VSDGVPPVVGEALVVTGLSAEEREVVIASWGRLDARLRSFRPETVELHLVVKDRGGQSQRTTLEAWIAGRPRLVATSDAQVLEVATSEVRDDLIRQLTDQKTRTEPRNNRSLRGGAPPA
jgi:hypothetical protein